MLEDLIVPKLINENINNYKFKNEKRVGKIQIDFLTLSLTGFEIR